jgi:hypothetical protein
MISKIVKWLSLNSRVLITYGFWGYFVVFILLHRHIPTVFDYLLFLLGGIYAGNKIAFVTMNYLKNNP